MGAAGNDLAQLSTERLAQQLLAAGNYVRLRSGPSPQPESVCVLLRAAAKRLRELGEPPAVPVEALRQVGEVARRYAHAHGVLVGALSIAVDELTSGRFTEHAAQLGRSLGEVLEAHRDPLIDSETPAPAAGQVHP